MHGSIIGLDFTYAHSKREAVIKEEDGGTQEKSEVFVKSHRSLPVLFDIVLSTRSISALVPALTMFSRSSYFYTSVLKTMNPTPMTSRRRLRYRDDRDDRGYGFSEACWGISCERRAPTRYGFAEYFQPAVKSARALLQVPSRCLMLTQQRCLCP
uniref:Uncharacterized protein n=1 Tax=Panagrellus redivivus TaxID=6233 RepID=A0A7E4VSM0_PANRE